MSLSSKHSFAKPLLIVSITIGLQASPIFATTYTPVPIPLAVTYNQSAQININYLVSEKLDGIRAIWTGQGLITRRGNPIIAPSWFTQDLPPFALDGELWASNLSFEEIQSTVLTLQPNDNMWQSIQYHIFDRPDTQQPFAVRYKNLEQWFSGIRLKDHLRLVSHHKVSDTTQLNRLFNEVITRGGEGLILRDPDTTSINGRQQGMLKLKPYQDAEATVIGYRAGKGKYTGLVGSLIVRDSNNVEFAIGSGLSDKLRLTPPEIGSQITYRYQNLTQKGKPRFARFLRVRFKE
ncbi:DNA ligase [Vibrio sp. WJH972]